MYRMLGLSTRAATGSTFLHQAKRWFQSTRPLLQQQIELSGTDLPHRVDTEGVPIFIYTHSLESEALEQLKDLARSPISTGFVSATPDVHLGKGATVGSVFASDVGVAPSAVGSDIGCGMVAVPVDNLVKSDLPKSLCEKIEQEIYRRIPMGFDSHSPALPEASAFVAKTRSFGSPFLRKALASGKASEQLGSLGGGNHFIEVLHDEKERVWVVLHSGSRFVGLEVATHYDKHAMTHLRSVKLDQQKTLPFLPLESLLGQDYLKDMEWCQRYALENRRLMMNQMCDIIEKFTGGKPNVDKMINIHHNYTQQQECEYDDPLTGKKEKKTLWVTRKGATSAKKGELGIIPGSMGTGIYIVRGKGNPLSWQSCSHGAGRVMSRAGAKRQISQSDFVKAMDGIVCDTGDDLRDEAPQAYKDLHYVMKCQSDLVDTLHFLKPMINTKGHKRSAERRERLQECCERD